MEFPKCELIEISIENQILILTINNPPHNYLPSQFFIELDACKHLVNSNEIDAVIITGKKNVFSKGADISEIKSKSGQIDIETIKFGNDVFSFLSNFEKPVIAAIQGACLGGGLELALACHLRVCSDKTRIGLPELTAGVIPGLGGIPRLTRVVGEAKATEMILLGDILSASQALEVNLVSRIFTKEEFLSKVIKFTRMMLATRSDAIREFLKLITYMRSKKEEEDIRRSSEVFIQLIKNLQN